MVFLSIICTGENALSHGLTVFGQLSEFFNVDGEASARLAAAPERFQGTVTATSYNYKQIVCDGFTVSFFHCFIQQITTDF